MPVKWQIGGKATSHQNSEEQNEPGTGILNNVVFTKHISYMVAAFSRLLFFGTMMGLLVWVDPSAVGARADTSILLTIEGANNEVLATYTADDLAAMPRTTATVDRDGEAATYEGVLLYNVLLRAYGVPPGKSLPVNAKMTYIVGTARDGYQAMFAMGEIAPVFAGARVLIADKRNGGPLLARQQPLQMVAPQDKAQGRAMFSLVRLQIVELKSKTVAH